MNYIESDGAVFDYAERLHVDPEERLRRIYGVDFSGAADAGQKIWVASGSVEADHLVVEDCRRAEDLPGSGRSPDRCLPALRELIAGEAHAVFGLDFPFGLPAKLVGDYATWAEFVLSFSKRHPDPEQFRRHCVTAAAGDELMRRTDHESHAPFSAYNIRLYRQTYLGIRDVLAPLVRDQRARVLPMQSPLPNLPWVVEICPACTLKQQGLAIPYKGKAADRQANRRCILETIERITPLHIPSTSLRAALVDDTGGDALDSIIAAAATFRSLPRIISQAERRDPYVIEGFVYK